MQRKANELRPIRIERHALTRAPGSVLFEAEGTRVLCTAMVSADLPPWMRNQEEPRGWITAEYNMLPASVAPGRKQRKQDGRGTEIQRLISRVLRAAVDLPRMPGLLVTCDCEVLAADGGTRTAAITGAWIALVDALREAQTQGLLKEDPLVGQVAAVSVGIVDGVPTLDLDYALDSRAEVDMNVAMNSSGRFIEVQGTGEAGTFSREEMDSMLDLAADGIRKLMELQKAALSVPA